MVGYKQMKKYLVSILMALFLATAFGIFSTPQINAQSITWDDKKRQQVIKTHGVDFEKIEDVLDDPFAVYIADFEHGRLLLDRHAFARAARVADEDGMLLQRGREHHVHQFIFILRSHGDDVGQAAQVGDVEETVMRGSVVGGKA